MVRCFFAMAGRQYSVAWLDRALWAELCVFGVKSEAFMEGRGDGAIKFLVEIHGDGLIYFRESPSKIGFKLPP